MRVWLITGAGRGVGASIAGRALSSGDFVVATARYPAHVRAALGRHDRLLVLPLNVTREAHARAAVLAAVARVGRIDVLVNNAGYGLLGAIEEASAAEVASLFQTNVFGLLNVTRALLPLLRKQGSGHIVNISSIGGCAAGAGWGIYCATKLAIEAVSEALSEEGEPLGIYTTVIDPGDPWDDFRSSIALVRTARQIEDYEEAAFAIQPFTARGNSQLQAVRSELADEILKLVQTPEPPRRLRLRRDRARASDFQRDTLIREIERSGALVLPADTVC